METIFEILSSPNAPAWVQAIGAILAIIASYFIFLIQHKKEIERSLEASKEIRLSKIRSIIVMMDNTNNTCQRIAEKIKSQEAIWDLEMNFLSSHRDRLNSIPVFDIPSPSLVSYLSNLISRIQVAEISLRQLNIETAKERQLPKNIWDAMELPLHVASDFATLSAHEARAIAIEENLGDIDNFLSKTKIKILQKNETYFSSFMARIKKIES